MDEYIYCVEDSQFSFEFRAPLLGKENDYISLFDFDLISKDQIVEVRKVHIIKIDYKAKIINCTGNIGE